MSSCFMAVEGVGLVMASKNMAVQGLYMVMSSCIIDVRGVGLVKVMSSKSMAG